MCSWSVRGRCNKSSFHIDDGGNFFDDVKEWHGPFSDAHQLGVMLNFDVDVKKAAVDVKKKNDTVTHVKTLLASRGAFLTWTLCQTTHAPAALDACAHAQFAVASHCLRHALRRFQV